MHRRDFLRNSSLAALAGYPTSLTPRATDALENLLATIGPADPSSLAEDDAFWMTVRKSYVTSTDLIDFDNANTGPTPASVFNAFVAHGQTLRQAPSERFGKVWDELDTITRPDLASFLGAKPAEVCFTPNTTYGLNTVLHGYPLSRGDEIIVTNHEYPDMVATILQRSRREGIVMRIVNVPSIKEDQHALTASIERAITTRTRLLLISHVSAWSGEILPVKEVTRVAKQHNVAVLVDAAQSVGILNVSFSDIGADFLATSLHKGLAAPMGTGALLMQTKHIGKVWPLHPPSWDTSKHPMDLYEWSGTFSVAAYRSTSDALKFQRTLGLERKRARIRFLGDYWVKRLRDVRGISILTPESASRSFGVAAFMIDGVPSETVAKKLREKGIIVQDKSGRHSPFKNAIRVSPGVYATTGELDRFVDAVKKLAG